MSTTEIYYQPLDAWLEKQLIDDLPEDEQKELSEKTGIQNGTIPWNSVSPRTLEKYLNE